MKPGLGLGVAWAAFAGFAAFVGVGAGCAKATDLFGAGGGGEAGAGGASEGGGGAGVGGVGTGAIGSGGFTSGTASGGAAAGGSTSSTTSSSSTGGVICGDAICGAGETCTSCSADCGACPPVCGDGTCLAPETCTTCPADCGSCTCAHDVCAEGAALTSGCSPCVSSICAVDSFCCTNAWDSQCVAEVASICGTPCPGGTCSHPLCTQGAALVSGCDPCVTSICSVDSFCCNTSWDSLCVDEVGSVCGMPCAGGGCAHDKCVQGSALVSGCDPCVTSICNVDPFCCNDSWDSLCVDEVASVCGQFCP